MDLPVLAGLFQFCPKARNLFQMHDEKNGLILLKNSFLIEAPIADSIPVLIGDMAMMGPRQEAQAELFYGLCQKKPA